MEKRRAVTISVTPDEYDSICTAFGENFNKCEGAEDDAFVEDANLDGNNFKTFQAKYKKACQRQLVRDTIKEALTTQKSKEQ